MNKKRFLAGIIATLMAMGSTAFACHFANKKNSVSKEPVQVNNVKYGIPENYTEEDKTKSKEVVEKYGIPNNPPLLKYAAPPFLNDPVGEPTVMPMYALPDPEIIKDQESSSTSEKNQNPWK